MAKDVDLQSKEWTDIVFEGKNKDFGAYTLRNDSPRRHTRAVAIVMSVIAALVVLLILLVSGVFEKEEIVEDAEVEREAGAGVDDLDDVDEDEPVQDIDMPDEPEEIPEPEQLEEEVASTQALTELNIVEQVDKDKEIQDKDVIKDDLSKIGTETHEGTDDLSKAAVMAEVVEEKKPEVEKPKDEGPISMAMVEQKPTFPGGDSAMYAWIGKNLNYPAQASEEGASGKVTVSFVVERDGSITNVKVVRGKHPALDAEAVRVIKSMPKWTPGRNNGAPVRVTYMLPVTFKLQ